MDVFSCRSQRDMCSTITIVPPSLFEKRKKSAYYIDNINIKGAMVKIGLKRAYEPPAPDDGYRVLVDRVWPRGVSKDSLQLDLWLKDIAPSTALRKWFNHDVYKWAEFQRRYRDELKDADAELEELRELLRQGRVTLVYGAKDDTHNQAVVLRNYFLKD